MGAGVRNYTQADTGDLGKYIGGKIKAARQLASAAKKQNEDSGIETGRGYFFGKALASEFGGDRLARTKGFLSKNPSDTNDPALSKKERFQNLIRGELSKAPGVTQLGIPGIAEDEFNQTAPLKSWLTPLLDGIVIGNQKISEGIKGLGRKQEVSSEQQDKTNKGMTSFERLLGKLKDWITGDDYLKEEELELEEEQLDIFKDAQSKAQAAKSEAQLEQTNTYTGEGEGSDTEKDGGSGAGKGGIFGDLIDNLLDGLGEIADGLGDRFRNRDGDRNNKKNKNNNKKNDRPRSRTSRPKTNIPSGPTTKPRGVWGRIAQGATRFIRRSEGVSPLASGLYDRPATGKLPPNKGVIPLNRNNPFAKVMNKAEDKVKEERKNGQTKSSDIPPETLAKAPQALTMAGGTVLLGALNYAMGSPLFGPFSDSVRPVFQPLTKVFGMPETILRTGASGSAGADGVDGIDGADGGGKFRTKGGLLGKLGKKIKGMFENMRGNTSSNSPSGPSGPGSYGPSPYSYTPAGTVNGSRKFTKAMLGRGVGVRDNLGSGRSPGGHTGIDIGVANNEKISIGYPGKVIDVGIMGDANDTSPKKDNGGYGNFAVIKLDSGDTIKLAHFNSIAVSKGQRVEAGTLIGKAGSTGLSTAPHVHVDVGDGYNPATAQFTTLYNGESFILNGGIQYGGNFTASPSGTRTGNSRLEQGLRSSGAGQTILTSNPIQGITTSIEPAQSVIAVVNLPTQYISGKNKGSVKTDGSYAVKGGPTSGVLESDSISSLYNWSSRGVVT